MSSATPRKRPRTLRPPPPPDTSAAPRISKIYQLEGTPADVRRSTLLQFRKNGAVTDPRVTARILAAAEMEFEETVNQWKQRGHLMNLLDPEVPPPDPMLDAEEFFRRFLDGSLSSKDVWMGWSRAEQVRVLNAVAADPESDSRVSAEDLHKWSRKWRQQGGRLGGAAPAPRQPALA